MTKLLERARDKFLSSATAVKTAGTTLVLTGVSSMTAFASESGAGSGIHVDFDTSQMFTFANVIIESLMPVVYITAGLGIGFLIINSLKNAFR